MNSKDYWIIGIITLVIFAGTYAVLSIFGFVPKEFRLINIAVEDERQDQNNFNFEDIDKGETEILLPDRIKIPSVGVDSQIQRPESQDISVLDQALNKGAVYYPGSGTINVGNMFIFGHSTGFAVVNNQAYKTFNDLEDLNRGDEILIDSGEKTFVYKVDSVNLVDENEAYVDFTRTDRMLTISTCNTFGQKQERWVVEASFDREI
jgi:LPXTG-site transpeptidase (sortase) family protein